MSSWTLSDGSNSLSMWCPGYGYETEIAMPMTGIRAANGEYLHYDEGSSYDRRRCLGAKIFIEGASMGSVNTILGVLANGRGEAIELQLGAGCGWYPFGPDKGDAGTFSARVLRYRQSGALMQPWGMCEIEFDLLMVSAPIYSPTDDMDEASYALGTATGLREPPGGFLAETTYAVDTVSTMDGTALEIDNGSGADRYETQFEVTANQGKMATIVTYLTGVAARGNNYSVNLTTPNGLYPFGFDQASGGTFAAQVMETSLRVRHTRFDEFALPLKMRYKA